ncbi:MAG: phosphatase PAP2 family protein [Candidatus Brachytrichaceae bacterium NZ_4S206]|jgi:membrane-associated phospholipid phosphatase
MTYPAAPGQVVPEALFVSPLRQPRLDRVAGWVSNATHPPIVGVFSVIVAALISAKAAAWLWGVGYLVLAVLLPTLYVAWLVRRGEITDMQLPDRRQRLKPYCVAIACMGLAALALQWAQAPRLLQQIALINVVQSAALLLTTLRWKISAHCASMGALAVLTWALFGAGSLPFCAAVPAVAWARVRLKRHDAMQVLAGAMLGVAIAWIVLR